MIAGLSFTTPLLLWALLALPLLWWILRAVPPAPIRRRFPGVALLVGLRDQDSQAETTPLWLLLLRMAALGLVVIGLAGPVLNPNAPARGAGQILVVMDASWASARDWPARMARLEALLTEAGRAGQSVAIQPLTAPLEPPVYQGANAWIERLPGLRPEPFVAAPQDVAAWADTLDLRGTEVIWMSDGLSKGDSLPLVPDRVIQSPAPIFGLAPAIYDEGAIHVAARRAGPSLEARDVTLLALGLGPTGGQAQLASTVIAFAEGEAEASVSLSLPPELRNRITRFEIAGQRSAGAVSLADDGLQRREVALMSGESEAETQNLLDPLFYLRRALDGTADVLEGELADMLLANPDVLILADVARFAASEAEAVADWVDRGGMLVRFAGPRLAASDEARDQEAPLLPVRLRSGGRTVGGALSWGEPKTLRPFPEDSPFAGLPVPQEVTVTSQVMAQPDVTLADRTIAALADGTPLVTRKPLGQGEVVLFHITANAEWSSLPLSGLFVHMLERLAISTRPTAISVDELAGTTWSPRLVLDGFGQSRDAGNLAGIAGEDLAQRTLGPDLRPGLYEAGARRIARNVITADTALAPATWPEATPIEGMTPAPEVPLMPYLMVLALALLGVDVLASLWLGGRLRGAVAVLALLLLPQGGAQAQQSDEAKLLQAASQITLAHVITGDQALDRTTKAGLAGLSEMLTRRTSVEPAPPHGVNLETDELSVYPLLYWPITPAQPTPSTQAYAALNAYLRSGGLILFDTRDANLGGFGQTENGRKLQALAAPLDIPALEQIPRDHILTRTFYLLQDFPGRHASRDVWVEAAQNIEEIEGLPFRNLNDGVTPVLIGGNDWAAAWALDGRGAPLLPIGRGQEGEMQREVAYRFGINVVMHALSGNYKSDQVHVPALLDRLSQ